MREAYLTGNVTPATDAEASSPAEVNLTKIKLDAGALYVEYTTGEADGQAECTARHKRPVHPDLLAAFAVLTPHLCLLCDLVAGVVMEGGEYVVAEMLYQHVVPAEAPRLHERREFNSYHVTGITFSNTGVVLVGQKRYRSGKKVLNLVSPHEALEPEHETGDEYAHLWELRHDLNRVEAEARLYLAGKHGSAVVQGELQFDATDSVAEKAPFGPLSDIIAEVDEIARQNAARKAGKKGAANDD